LRLCKVEISSICRGKIGQRFITRAEVHFVRRRSPDGLHSRGPIIFWIESRDELRISGSLSYCVYHRRHSRLEAMVFQAQEKKPRVKSDSRGREAPPVRRRAGRGTFHLPNSGGPSRAALPRDGAKEARGSNAKAPRQSERARISGMQWYRLSFSCAAGATGAQNLSTAV
jgi:hypothetical protein